MLTRSNLLPMNLFFHFDFENVNLLRILTFGKSRFQNSFFTFENFDHLKFLTLKNVFIPFEISNFGTKNIEVVDFPYLI